jgi:hypothetical protein
MECWSLQVASDEEDFEEEEGKTPASKVTLKLVQEWTADLKTNKGEKYVALFTSRFPRPEHECLIFHSKSWGDPCVKRK